MLGALGCHNSPQAGPPTTTTYSGVTLKVGALDDSAIMSAVSLLRGEWEASRNGSISPLPNALSIESIDSVDVILFPGERLGDMVDVDALAKITNAMVIPEPTKSESAEDEPGQERKSAESEQLEDSFRYQEIAPAFRDQVTRYGTDRLGLPCGGSALVLVYRRDAFERESNQAAAKAAGLELKPPTLWTKLDALARFFEGRDWDGDSKPDHGIALALGADSEGVGTSILLARATSLGQHRDHFSFLFEPDKMIPRVATAPFLEALTSLVALKSSGPSGMQQFDAAAARAAFKSGHVALLIDRAERASTWSHGKPLGVAPLPGSDRVFEPSRKEWSTVSPANTPSYLPEGGGWLIGVKRSLSGPQFEAAIDFARYLANPENSNRIRSEPTFPMLPVRLDQMGQGLPDPTSSPDVDSRLWSDAVRRTFLAERVVPGLRIPGARGYLDDLAKARAAAANGEDAEKALVQVAESWNKRTALFGLNRMRWHYQRGLNRLATSPEPPGRGK